MTDLVKANMQIEGDHLVWSMPFEKGSINKEKREVSGFATLNNVDTQGDVVLAEASKDAFERCRGNIREMHQPSAVGKLRNFVEKTVFDDDGNVYTGIYVTVHISKGAENAWLKVLDGTYTGFSIGGNITDSESQWVKDAGASIRFIKSYDLVELSIVDNPANQLANIFSISKAANGATLVKGMITEVRTENAFWCPTHSITETSADKSLYCSICKSEMEFMGEISADANTQELGELVKKFLGKGGINKMTDENKKTEEVDKPEQEVVNQVAESEANKDSKSETDDGQVPSEEAEKTAEHDETDADDKDSKVADEANGTTNTDPVLPVINDNAQAEAAEQEAQRQAEAKEYDETAENDLEKVINDLKNVVQKSVNESREIAEEATRKFEETFTKSIDSLTSEISETKAKYDELSKKLDTVKSENEETRKSLEIALGNTAFKKSGEVESPEASPKKSGIFGGVFLSTDEL